MENQNLSYDAWRPSHSPWLIALAVMLPTFMEILDTAVANVALPHIAGNLSATTHEATWALTSYLISNAVILPATAWFSGFFGRKRFLMVCVVIFTLSSALCGFAGSLGFLIFARVLQGAGGGGLQPISQAILLESFPKERRGMAMAVFALGAIIAPIIGPVIGGWITDNFSWRWIFFINIPIGVISVFLAQKFIEDPPYIQKRSLLHLDYIGFSLMAVGLGALQLVLDKGQEVDWFAADWVVWTSVLVVAALSAFVFWELRVKEPVVNLRILKDGNFHTGVFLITVLGFVLYGTTVLLPLFLQTLMGYNALHSGLALSPRGIFSFMMAAVVGKLVSRVDGRYIVACGLVVLGVACYQLGNINLAMGPEYIFLPVIFSGMAISAIFIPLTTLAMATLERSEMGNATGLYNLMRNIGGSVGISMAATFLARMSQVHQNALVSHLTPYDPAYQEAMRRGAQVLAQAGGVVSPDAALGFIYRETVRQASLLAFIDNFHWFGLLCLACVPSVWLFKRVRQGNMAH
ncbi:MAG: DHA2 family efflux MFS transporter permease subunit [Candidatus Omnitrophica bacterium]|nr:DHA2 family efflux MFS transporter permease subunit [Candidatus Omnitrophota bacterium]